MSDIRRPSSLGGIKRLAKQLKSDRGISHQAALEVAAAQAGFQNFTHARHRFEQPVPQPVLIRPFQQRPSYHQDMEHFEFLAECRRAWIDTLDHLNPARSDRMVWTRIEDILHVLDVVHTASRTHAHLPTGGGIDFSGVRLANEPGCLELQRSGAAANVVRPKSLTLERVATSPVESFVLLELQDLARSGIYAEYDQSGEPVFARLKRYEELVELRPGAYVDRRVWDDDGLGEDENGDEIPLPVSARLVVRRMNGKMLFVTKGSLWNDTPETYDGCHDAMMPETIRAMIDRLASARAG